MPADSDLTPAPIAASEVAAPPAVPPTAPPSAPAVDAPATPDITPLVATAPACPNCFSLLPDPRPRFCGACGQETNVRPPKLGEFLQQFGGAYFSTEGALWRTLVLLLLQPGELTRRYLAGRRKHYVLPLRLYITVSLTALLLMRLGTPTAIQLGGPAEAEAGKVSEIAINREAAFTVLDFGDGRRAGMENGRFYCEKLPSWICSPLQARLDLDAKSFARELQLWPERFLSRWGTAMFLLVPNFALLHKLVYFSRRMRYTEHLVYALHMHSFWFLALALSLLPQPATAVAAVAMPAYGVFAARRVYGGGWAGTLARTLVIAAIYGIVLGMALGVVTAWAFFFN
jgi:hypothetical protein